MMTMLPTCHRLRLFRRYWRMRALSREVPETPMLSSCSHCLTMSAMDAEAREQTRLENQSALIHTAEVGAWKGGLSSSSVSGCCVELTNDGLTEKLFSCADICFKTARDGSVGSGWSSWYDCTLNAVRTAENRPACGRRNRHESESVRIVDCN